VLIRALEPIEGLDLMRERRGLEREDELCSGPGKLTQALGIELELNDTSLVEGPILVHPREDGWADPALIAGPRVGITKAADLPWRFCAAGSRHVSRPWPPGFRATLGPRVLR
jgi:DNA-3-methyladenine glycosylase